MGKNSMGQRFSVQPQKADFLRSNRKKTKPPGKFAVEKQRKILHHV